MLLGNIIIAVVSLAVIAFLVFQQEVSKRSIGFVIGVGVFYTIIEVIRQTTHWL